MAAPPGTERPPAPQPPEQYLTREQRVAAVGRLIGLAAQMLSLSRGAPEHAALPAARALALMRAARKFGASEEEMRLLERARDGGPLSEALVQAVRTVGGCRRAVRALQQEQQASGLGAQLGPQQQLQQQQGQLSAKWGEARGLMQQLEGGPVAAGRGAGHARAAGLPSWRGEEWGAREAELRLQHGEWPPGLRARLRKEPLGGAAAAQPRAAAAPRRPALLPPAAHAPHAHGAGARAAQPPAPRTPPRRFALQCAYGPHGNLPVRTHPTRLAAAVQAWQAAARQAAAAGAAVQQPGAWGAPAAAPAGLAPQQQQLQRAVLGAAARLAGAAGGGAARAPGGPLQLQAGLAGRAGGAAGGAAARQHALLAALRAAAHGVYGDEALLHALLAALTPTQVCVGGGGCCRCRRLPGAVLRHRSNCCVL